MKIISNMNRSLINNLINNINNNNKNIRIRIFNMNKK